MARTKSIEELSAKELYKLAEKREKQEQENKIAENKAKIDELKSKRKTLIAAHRQELAAIDRQLKKLTGKTAAGKSGRDKKNGGTTDSILALLKSNKTMTTAQIRAELEKDGQTVNNLSQTLAYLKRTQRVTSPARSTYTLT